MTDLDESDAMHDPRTVLYWYDLICPFCYVAQSRNAILVRNGLRVVELSFQAHPDIPQGGVPAGARVGPMYAMLEREAREAGLPLRWPPRLPDTRQALATAEWVRRNQPSAFPRLHADLFRAHFALGEDIGDTSVIDRHAKEAGVDLPRLRAGRADGSVAASAREAESIAHEYGVRGTPTWRIGHRTIEGLVQAVQFERLAAEYAGSLPMPGQGPQA
jgi:predicted DsbA family dithiol-disulfide isomerase